MKVIVELTFDSVHWFVTSCSFLSNWQLCNKDSETVNKQSDLITHCLLQEIKRRHLFVLLHVDKLPLSIRVLLEAAVRNCDGFYTREEDVQNILDWQQQQNKTEVPFSPARVLLQDFTWVSQGFWSNRS